MSDPTIPGASSAQLPEPALAPEPDVATLDPEAPGDTAAQSSRITGLGRVLVMVYVVLALAASFRSFFQIVRKFDEAPLAYLLSALAGVVYVVAAIALTRKGAAWRRIAWAALAFELVGVIVVGALSFLAPQWFAHPSVWSWFGSGYLFIPLVLPVLGLVWLSRSGNHR